MPRKDDTRPAAVLVSGKTRRSNLRPTIGQVAEAAGVAKTTVSAILNNRPHCYASEITRSRVKLAAGRLGYRPTPSARGLMGKPTGVVGVVISGVDTEVFARRLAGFENAARRAGNVTIFLTTNNQPDQEDASLRRLIDQYVDGIAIYPTERGPHKELGRLVKHGFPLVTLDGGDRLGMDLPISDVSPDYRRIGRLQAEHLMETGRRRIGLVTGEERCYVNDRKIEGFREALNEAGLKPVEHIRLSLQQQTTYHWLVDEFEQLREELQRYAPRLDAVATVGDPIGLAIIRYATELGVRVPEDLAVVSTDGMSAAGLGGIPLSTVALDPDNTGSIAFKLLHEQCAKRDARSEPQRIVTPVHLHARASTIGHRPV